MADELIDDVLVNQNGLITYQNSPLILEHDLEDDNAIPLADEIQDMNVLNQVVEEVFEEENEDEELENGNIAHNNGVVISSELPVSPVHSESSNSLVSFDESEILGTSSPGPGMKHGCYFSAAYHSDSSELSHFEDCNEFQAEGNLAETLPRKRNSPEVSSCSDSDFDTETRSSTNRYDNSELFQPNPLNSPAKVRADLNECGSVIQFLESDMHAEYGLDPEERSYKYYAGADPQVRVDIIKTF